ARGVADGGGAVADDEHDLVAEVLELPQLAQHDGVADVQVAARGVDAELDAQLPPLAFGQLELLQQAALGHDLLRAALEERERLPVLVASFRHGGVHPQPSVPLRPGDATGTPWAGPRRAHGATSVSGAKSSMA